MSWSFMHGGKICGMKHLPVICEPPGAVTTQHIRSQQVPMQSLFHKARPLQDQITDRGRWEELPHLPVQGALPPGHQVAPSGVLGILYQHPVPRSQWKVFHDRVGSPTGGPQAFSLITQTSERRVYALWICELCYCRPTPQPQLGWC